MTQSVRDYLDQRFESEEIKAALATDGVIEALALGGDAVVAPER